MVRNIKITEKQYNMLQEMDDDDFAYFTNDDTKPYDGQVNITADGKLNAETNSDPTMGDKVQQTMTPQGYARYRSYGNIYPRTMREGINPIQDKNKDGVDDFYNHDELDILSNGKEEDNLTKIPVGIDTKTQMLVDAIKGNNLMPKQQAMILNKLIEVLDISKIPFSWKKELMLKLASNKNMSNNVHKKNVIR